MYMCACSSVLFAHVHVYMFSVHVCYVHVCIFKCFMYMCACLGTQRIILQCFYNNILYYFVPLFCDISMLCCFVIYQCCVVLICFAMESQHDAGIAFNVIKMHHGDVLLA